jgi:hypothetical protein
MSYSVKVIAPRKPATPNASALARAQGDAVIGYLRDSLVNGYVPATGEARPRKGDGKPLGFDTGKTARGLRLVSAGSTRDHAAFRITVSADRAMLEQARPEFGGMSFIERYQIITLEGRVQELIEEGTAEYMRSLR